jgi:predicted AAA+ superfamily ATPase
MQIEKLNKRLEYLHELVENESTGSPEALSKKLGISKRMVFNYLNYLSETKNTKIVYSKFCQTYKYNSKSFAD